MNAVNHQRRLLLTRATKVLALIGLGFVVYPFFAAFLPDSSVDAQRQQQWQHEIDLSDLQVGELRLIEGWPGGSVAVYKRHADEIAALTRENGQLHDAMSEFSMQPDALRTATRSALPDYFLFIPVDTERGCQIRYIPPNKQPRADIAWQGGYSEPCLGSLYDTAGRVYRGYRSARQQNLVVPEYRILTPQRLQLTGLGKAPR